jgi:hypothetical protein
MPNNKYSFVAHMDILWWSPAARPLAHLPLGRLIIPKESQGNAAYVARLDQLQQQFCVTRYGDCPRAAWCYSAAVDIAAGHVHLWLLTLHLPAIGKRLPCIRRRDAHNAWPTIECVHSGSSTTCAGANMGSIMSQCTIVDARSGCLQTPQLYMLKALHALTLSTHDTQLPSVCFLVLFAALRPNAAV